MVATVSALEVETVLANDGQVVIVEDRPTRHPGLYVEISARQSGKTQRLVTAVAQHCERNPHNLAIVISPWMQEEYIRARIHGINQSNQQRNLPPHPIPGERQIMAVASQEARLAMVGAERRLDDERNARIGNREAQAGEIRWFFDDWDQMEVPEHWPGLQLPFYETGYYATTLNRLRGKKAMEDPWTTYGLFRRLMAEADRVVSYRRGEHDTALSDMLPPERLRLDDGGIFDPEDRPDDEGLPLVELYRLGSRIRLDDVDRKGLFPISIC